MNLWMGEIVNLFRSYIKGTAGEITEKGEKISALHRIAYVPFPRVATQLYPKTSRNILCVPFGRNIPLFLKW